MEDLQKQTIEKDVDEMFERSDKVIHDIFSSAVSNICMDYELSQNENNETIEV